ncbi:class I adenylate-forming enzyme family protein [Candidatus Pantoea multigeneris]|uniref:AMP-binding protein n=1 Tax=Candidatus Pantoea multigeneris TaxID=2608357 RepID=A0ABX0RA97_9GAMM|nr:AMP-binding protein [Pantoea multigeneris]
MPVHDKIAGYARQKPHQIAITHDEGCLSWQQLWRWSVALYQQIRAHAEHDRVIGLACGNHLAFVPGWLAATAKRHTCAVFDPDLPAARLDELLSRVKPDELLLTREQTALAQRAQQLDIAVRYLDDLREQEVEDDAEFCAEVNALTPFLINFTSGTTSLPKAFTRHRRSWWQSLRDGYGLFGLGETTSTLFPGPLFHGIGLYALNEALDAGHHFYSLSKWSGAGTLALLAEQNIDRLIVVPTMLAAFAELPEQPLNQVKRVLSAGAKMQYHHFASARSRFPAAQLQEYYGASELGFIAVSSLTDENVDDQLLTVGVAFPGTTLSIRNQQDECVAPGETGTIWLQSPQICGGYLWGDESHAFRHTAVGATVQDLGYLDAQGRLVVMGRSGDMVTVGGNNVYLAEIEAALKTLDDVQEVVVLAADDLRLGKKLLAFIRGQHTDFASLPQRSRQLLAKYKIPHHFVAVSHWPLTVSGKIDRRALLQEFHP